MNDQIVYCVKGCHRQNADGKRERTHAVAGAHLCRHCIDRLEKWLAEIPERYAMLPQYLMPSADLSKNPETKATKSAHVPAPLRLPALDLLDTRRGRKWLGTEPTEDRRGALGVLHAIANEIRVAKNINIPTDPHVIGEASFINKNLEWLAGQDWVSDSYDEIRILFRELGDAVGQYPPKPVGVCVNEVVRPTDDNPNPDPVECGGPLLPITTGVFCPHCSRHWGHMELRFLGRQLGEPA